MICRVSYIPGGAGFPLSTVSLLDFPFFFGKLSSCQVFVLNSFATKGELSFPELVQAQTYWKTLQRKFSMISTSEFCFKKRSKKTHTYPHRESNIYIYTYNICIYYSRIHIHKSKIIPLLNALPWDFQWRKDELQASFMLITTIIKGRNWGAWWSWEAALLGVGWIDNFEAAVSTDA